MFLIEVDCGVKSYQLVVVSIASSDQVLVEEAPNILKLFVLLHFGFPVGTINDDEWRTRHKQQALKKLLFVHQHLTSNPVLGLIASGSILHQGAFSLCPHCIKLLHERSTENYLLILSPTFSRVWQQHFVSCAEGTTNLDAVAFSWNKL